jgi:MFS family permease
MNNVESAIVFSAHLIGFAIASLLVVPLTDRIPSAHIMLAGIVLLVATNLIFPLAASGVWSATLIRILSGVGHMGSYVPAIRVVSDRFDGSRRGTAVGVYVGLGYAGTTGSYSVTGLFLGIAATWQTAYLYAALPGILAALAAFPLLLYGAPAGAQEEAAPDAPKRGRFDLSVLRYPPVALCTSGYALHTAELYLARLWFPLLLTASLVLSGMDERAAVVRSATLSGFMFMLGIAGSFSGGVISDYLGRTRAAALIFAVSGLCSFIAGWLLGLPTLWLIVIGFIYGYSTAADSAIYLTGIIELAPPGRSGSAQAVQSFVGFAAGAAVQLVAGSLLDATTSPVRWIWAFGFNGLLAVLGVYAMLRLRRLPASLAMASGRR